MIQVGWIADYPSSPGGAEISERFFRVHAPEDFRVMFSEPEYIPRKVDCYAVQNCVQYDARLQFCLEERPFVKFCHDVWPNGDKQLRRWILTNAKLVFFCSELHQRAFSPRVDDRYVICPPPIDLKPFRDAANANRGGRQGTVWVGAIHPGKGLANVEEWARTNGEVVDVFGRGARPDSPHLNFRGHVQYSELPELLVKYERFIHLPVALEPFGRAVAEAWAAGCELVVYEDRIGAVEWIKERPEDIEAGNRLFWDVLREVVT